MGEVEEKEVEATVLDVETEEGVVVAEAVTQMTAMLITIPKMRWSSWHSQHNQRRRNKEEVEEAEENVEIAEDEVTEEIAEVEASMMMEKTNQAEIFKAVDQDAAVKTISKKTKDLVKLAREVEEDKMIEDVHRQLFQDKEMTWIPNPKLKIRQVEAEVREEADEVQIVNDKEVAEANNKLKENTMTINRISSQNETMRESTSVDMQEAKEQSNKPNLVNLLSKPTKKPVRVVKT